MTFDSKTTIVNIHTGASYDVYCGRPGRGLDGPFGNPFRTNTLGGGSIGRKEAVARFAAYFKARIQTDKVYAAKVKELRGKRLGCFCDVAAGQLCHCLVYTTFLDEGRFWAHADAYTWATTHSTGDYR